MSAALEFVQISAGLWESLLHIQYSQDLIRKKKKCTLGTLIWVYLENMGFEFFIYKHTKVNQNIQYFIAVFFNITIEIPEGNLLRKTI